MELFHGPTLAFKDFALQLVGQLFDHVSQRGERLTVVGATSGDTGSAIEACKDRDQVDIFILYPTGRVSGSTASNDDGCFKQRLPCRSRVISTQAKTWSRQCLTIMRSAMK